jgi:Holliday junction resolvase
VISLNSKAKGTNFERELIHVLWKSGFAAVRVAGSGSMSYPSPDIVASNGKITLAFEVKSRTKLPVYFPEQEIKDLIMFSNLFGAEPYIALKLHRRGWKFLIAKDLIKTSKGYKVDEETFMSGHDLNEVLGKYVQAKLPECGIGDRSGIFDKSSTEVDGRDSADFTQA